ncbi:MAG: hypothetical protein L0Y64_19715, partial [Myxococcaceae bacterium]|nr:hypothetical protein [Myxococcaceae bacterium]
MGLAICIRCGSKKERAFVACAGCGFDPAVSEGDREAQARSLLLSDAHMSPRELEDAGRALQAGRPYPYDAGQLAWLVQQLRTQPMPVIAPRKGLVLAVWVPVLVL